MEPAGVAGYVMVAANAVLGMMLGAFAGLGGPAHPPPVLRAGHGRLSHGNGSPGLCPPDGGWVVGLPPLTLTLLAPWLTARNLEAHTRLRRGWATVAGLGVGLLLGFLWGFWLRLGLPAAVSLALGTDAALIALLC